MKNIRADQLKKCIFMIWDEYVDLILNLTDDLLRPLYELDGISYQATIKAEETDTYWNQEIINTLSEWFDVRVTSVHADDCDLIGVWIVYIEEK